MGKSTAEKDIAQIPFERQQAVAHAANLETIRINRWRMYEDRNENTGSLDTTSFNLDLKTLEPGWIFVVNNITYFESGAGTPQVKLGFVREHQHHILTCQTVAAAENSVDYVGQVVLREGDKIRATVEGATAADSAYLWANGYKIKR